LRSKTRLLLLSLFIISSLACSVPLSLYELTGPKVDREEDLEALAADEQEYGFEVVPDPTDSSPEGSSSPSYQPTLAESQHQGLHAYRIEGTTNQTSQGTVSGSCQASHFFDQNGVRYHFIDSAPEAVYQRVSDNYYELVSADSKQSLRYFEGGFDWHSSNAMGGEMDLTFWLED